jgi:hypothetical protein
MLCSPLISHYKSSLVSSVSTLDLLCICGNVSIKETTIGLGPVVVYALKIDGWILLFYCLWIWLPLFLSGSCFHFTTLGWCISWWIICQILSWFLICIAGKGWGFGWEEHQAGGADDSTIQFFPISWGIHQRHPIPCKHKRLHGTIHVSRMSHCIWMM